MRLTPFILAAAQNNFSVSCLLEATDVIAKTWSHLHDLASTL